tara:strand:+ start:6121 stop:6621 length:501 start_codon:yes stop_codon:yes gene_type:complete
MPKKTDDPVEILSSKISAQLNTIIHSEDVDSLQAISEGLDGLLEDREKSVSKLDKVLEGYKPVRLGRMFYPRNFQLSEDFINAFHREYDRLVGEGQNSKSLVERFGKAMKFHAGDTRKYHKLDEKSEKKSGKSLPPWLKNKKGDKSEEDHEHDLNATGDHPHGDDN